MMMYVTLLSYFGDWFLFIQPPESHMKLALWVRHVVFIAETKNEYRVLMRSFEERKNVEGFHICRRMP
jgi:hypothetical protein